MSVLDDVVRRAHEIVRAEGYADPADALGMCLISAQRLAEEVGGGVAYIRVTGEEYPGREHWALIVPGAGADRDEALQAGTVVDMTARQFNPDAPALVVTPLNDWLDDACEWLVDGLNVEVYEHFTDLSDERAFPVWTEHWSREDVPPGPMTYRVGSTQ